MFTYTKYIAVFSLVLQLSVPAFAYSANEYRQLGHEIKKIASSLEKKTSPRTQSKITSTKRAISDTVYKIKAVNDAVKDKMCQTITSHAGAKIININVYCSNACKNSPKSLTKPKGIAAITKAKKPTVKPIVKPKQVATKQVEEVDEYTIIDPENRSTKNVKCVVRGNSAVCEGLTGDNKINIKATGASAAKTDEIMVVNNYYITKKSGEPYPKVNNPMKVTIVDSKNGTKTAPNAKEYYNSYVVDDLSEAAKENDKKNKLILSDNARHTKNDFVVKDNVVAKVDSKNNTNADDDEEDDEDDGDENENEGGSEKKVSYQDNEYYNTTLPATIDSNHVTLSSENEELRFYPRYTAKKKINL
jgi:hypothetical protein